MGWFGSRFILCIFTLSMVSIILFLFVERYAVNPLLPFDLFTTSFSVGLIGISVLWSLYMAWSTLIPLTAGYILHYNGYYDGLILVPCGVGYTFGTFLYNVISKHVHHFYLAIISIICMICFLAAMRISIMSDINSILAPMFLFGLSVSFMFIPFNLIIFSEVGQDNHRLASAVSNFIRVYLSTVAVELLHTSWQRYNAVYYASASSIDYYRILPSLHVLVLSATDSAMSWSLNVCSSISIVGCVFVFLLVAAFAYQKNRNRKFGSEVS